MTLTIKVTSIDLRDDAGVGPIGGSVGVVVTTDDPQAVALGQAQLRTDVRAIALPRAAWNALINACVRPHADDWPDAVIPHPVTKA